MLYTCTCICSTGVFTYIFYTVLKCQPIKSSLGKCVLVLWEMRLDVLYNGMEIHPVLQDKHHLTDSLESMGSLPLLTQTAHQVVHTPTHITKRTFKISVHGHGHVYIYYNGSFVKLMITYMYIPFTHKWTLT